MKKILFIVMCLFPIFVVFVTKDVLLEVAAENNFVPMAKLCLFIGANANSKYYPLTAAVKNNYIKMADLLIKKGANINIEDKNIATPLEIAVTNDNTDMTKLLLKNGATAGNNSNKLLVTAVQNNNTNMFSLLLEKGVVIGNSGNRLLETAVNKDNIDIAYLLFKNGVSIGNNGKKLLATAVKNNSTYMIDLLLENGADLNIENEQGKTPLEIGIEKDNADMVKFLLQKGANPNIKNKEGKTPIESNNLKYECSDNEVRSELLAAGAEDTICTVWGKAETYINKHQFKSAVKVIKDNSELLGKIQGKLTDKIYAAKNEYLEKEVNKYISKHQFQSARKFVKDNSGNSTLLSQIDTAQNEYLETQINKYLADDNYTKARQFVKQNKKNLNKDNYDYWLFEIDLQHFTFIESVLEEVAPAAGRFYSGRYCYDFVYKLEYISTAFPREMYKNQYNMGIMATEYKGFHFDFAPFGAGAMSNKYRKDLQKATLNYTYKDGTVLCEAIDDSYAASICERLPGFKLLERGVGRYNVPFVKYIKTGLPVIAGSCYR